MSEKLTAEQVQGAAADRYGDGAWDTMTEKLNALIAPLIAAARVDAAQKMRERALDIEVMSDEAAKSVPDQHFGYFQAGWDESRAAIFKAVRALSLPGRDEAFLRQKIEAAMRAQQEYNDAFVDWNATGIGNEPQPPTYESILRQPAKQKNT